LILRFRTDAPVLELTGVVADGGQTVQTMIVDGMLVPPKVLSSSRGHGGWNLGTMRIAFDSRRVRDIWIETAMAVAFVKVDQHDSLFSVDAAVEPQMTVVGDSYQLSRSAAFGNGGAIALELGARLGIRNVAIDGVGGTGYYNSGANVGNLNDRLPADAADGSAIYLVMAGLNDAGDLLPGGVTVFPSSATYQNSVTGYLAGLRAADPNALIVVTAPFCPNANLSDSTYGADSYTNPTPLGSFLYKAQVQKSAIQQVAGPWVYIDVLMGTGWLNSSGASGDVTNLQWFTGGTAGAGTTATYKPGNTHGGGGGGFGGIASIPILGAGNYTQAPEVSASGGTGTGLLLSSLIDGTGALVAVEAIVPGSGYTAGAGLPQITIDPTYQITAAVLGTPTLIIGINPDGQYPLASFAPPGSEGELNNIYLYLMTDLTHPSPLGVSYLSSRLAQDIYAAVLAL
jgi:lysophospholipase L1-like esterase